MASRGARFPWRVFRTPEARKDKKTWYDNQDKPANDTEGPTQMMPLFVARVLPDSTTQFTRYSRNGRGLVTEERSTYTADGGTADDRATSYQYGTNDIDVVTITNPLGTQ